MAVVSGIYRIVNKNNGKFYVGSSSDINRRYYRHLFDLKKNKHDNAHLQHAWNIYGKDAFDIFVLKECSISELLVEEQKELDNWFGKDACYNLTQLARHPVCPGEKRTEEVKRKISLAQKGKPRWTEEQKRQMSIDRKGRKHTPETIEKFRNRPKSCYTGIIKAQQKNVGRIYSDEHKKNISIGKLTSNKRKFEIIGA